MCIKKRDMSDVKLKGCPSTSALEIQDFNVMVYTEELAQRLFFNFIFFRYYNENAQNLSLVNITYMFFIGICT